MDEFRKSVMSGKTRAGKKSLLKHLDGKKLIRSQAIYSKCYDCNGMGDYTECDVETCALLPFSQYRKKGSDTTRRIAKKRAVDALGAVPEKNSAKTGKGMGGGVKYARTPVFGANHEKEGK